MPDSKTDHNTPRPTGRPLAIIALALAVIAALLSGITIIGVGAGFLPLGAIYAAGVPSTVQVIDSVDVNTTEELEVVVFAMAPSEDLTVKVERLSGTGQVAAPGTTNFGDQAIVTATGVTRAGSVLLFPIQSTSASDTIYQLVVTKAGPGGGPHDRRTLKVRFRAPAATPTPATPTPPGGGTPPTP